MRRYKIQSFKQARYDSLGIMNENFDEYFNRYVQAKEDGSYKRDLAALKEMTGSRRIGEVPEDYDDSRWDIDDPWYNESEEIEEGCIRITGAEAVKRLSRSGIMKPKKSMFWKIILSYK